MKKLIGLSAAALFLVSLSASAEDFDYDKLCTKVKQCAFEEIKKTTEVPEGMEQVFEQMFDSQCATMISAYNQKFESADLSSQANACAETVYDMSCEEMLALKGEPNTQACIDFKEAADEAGIDLENINPS